MYRWKRSDPPRVRRHPRDLEGRRTDRPLWLRWALVAVVGAGLALAVTL